MSRTTIAAVLALTIVGLLSVVLWVALGNYIKPQTPTQKKDHVQSVAIVIAGGVGSLSALAAVGNFYASRRNLEQQRELEVQRAQENALPAYLDQIVQLLGDNDRPLSRARAGDEVSILARVRTLTVLPRLDSERKSSVVKFLYEAGLIMKDRPVIDLKNADLDGADLTHARLNKADLRGARLDGAALSANMAGANLEGAKGESDETLSNMNWGHDPLKG